MRELRKPPALRRGDTLGLWAPSFPGPAVFPERFQRSVNALQSAGFDLALGASCHEHQGYAAATPQQLANELHSFLRAPEIAGIVCAVGGWTINAVLPYIDWELLRDRCKVIVGYSDISAFLAAALSQSQVVTFHGPMAIPQWGEHGGPWSYSIESFARVTMTAQPPGTLAPPDEWTDELLWWDRDDHRRRRPCGPGAWRGIKPGQGVGPLVAGCLTTLSLLVGTPYLPDLTGAILCLEAEGFTADRFWAHLLQWKYMGVLEHLNGLVIGRIARPQPMGTGYIDFDERLRAVVDDLAMPVVVDVDFGHTEPIVTLPLGVTARLDGTHGTLEILDAAVTE